MKITQAKWKAYTDELAKINQKAGQAMVQYAEKNGLNDRKALIDYAMALVSKYSEGSSELACQMYDEIARLQGANVPSAEPAAEAEYGEVAKSVNGTLKRSPEGKLIGDSVSRLVKRAGADTMLKNAMRDHAEFAWIPSGDSCAFCMMLASQGWRRASRSTIAGNHAEHIHANCHCEFAIRFTSDFDVAGYEPKQLRKEWDAAEGNTTAEKLNYLRRKMHSSEEMKFETEKLLDIHYEKHAAKFGNISKEEYLKEANELMQKDTSDNIMELQRSDNSTSRYDRINNEFIVINEDDTIRTFFKPALGEEYWEYEKERNK